MVYEKVIVKFGNTISQIANDYGYNLWDWKKVWEHNANSNLRKKRGKPENLQIGDEIVIPLPWKIINKSLSPFNKVNRGTTFSIRVQRSGVKGKNLRWVQTIFGDNQSLHPTPFGVDYPDDDEPFYYRTDELNSVPNRRKNFFDAPWRNPHPVRTTAWRAVLSICSVFEHRVSIFETIVWGVDFGKNGVNNKYPIRDATPDEISGHLNLLRIGMGRTKSFKSEGWTFREAPKYY